jgi:hypothetical protein
VKILITERTSDFHACIDGQPGKWGCGKTPMHAIADLVLTWRADFGIDAVKWPEAEYSPEKVAP